MWGSEAKLPENALAADVESGQLSPSQLGGDRDPSGILQTEVVIDRVTQFLLAAEITLRRLNRCVPK